MSSSVPSPRRKLIRYLIAAIKSLSVRIRSVEIDIDPKFLIDLVTANAPEIVFFRIEKESFEQSPRIRHGRGIARAQTAVNILKRFFLVVRRIFP